MAQVDWTDSAARMNRDGEPTPWDSATHVRYVAHPTVEHVVWAGTDDPAGVLEVGEVYELQRVEIHSYHTKLFLSGNPEKGFSSTSFEIVEDL